MNNPEIHENMSTDNSSNELIRFSILTRIAKAVCDDDDLIHIFKIAIQKVRHYCVCDSIYILYNNPQSKSFYLTPALNQDSLGKPFEVSIPHRDTILGKIVESHATQNYPDLKELSDLWPGDRHFFKNSEGCFLAVPILARDHLLGVFLLTNTQANAFDEKDQALVEDVAQLTALAMNRARLEHSEARWQEQAERLQKIYSFLLNVIDEPLALVNLKHDMIYQSNPAFETLVGYSAEELNGMNLSLVHDLIPLRNISHNGSHPVPDLMLRDRIGGQHSTKVHLLSFNQNDDAEILALYKVKNSRKFPQPKINPLMPLPEKILFTLSAPGLGGKFELNQFVYNLGEAFGARYATLHFVSSQTWNLELVVAHQLPELTNAVYDHPWMISISEGPFTAAIETNELLIFENVNQDERFLKWRPVAKKLGYQSLITVPLFSSQKVTGIISFFYESPHSFSGHEQQIFTSVGSLLSLRLENERLKQDARNFSQQIEVINQITNSINSSLHLEEVIKITALEISRVLDFDFTCVTLFDDSGENIDVFTITSAALNSRQKAEHWEPLDDSQFGWLHESEQVGLQKSYNFDFQLAAMEKHLQSKINLLLLSRGKYLGTFSIASLNPRQYQIEHQRFLSQIAAQVATAIQNARLFEAARQNVTELSALADISKSINSSLDINEVFAQIVKATAVALKAQICTMRLVQNDQPQSNVTSNKSEIKGGKLNGKYEKFVIKTIKERRPIFLKDMKEVMPGEINVNGFQKEASGSAFLAMPIILGDEALAIISLYWENKLGIEQHELNLIAMIANQAASAIQNARLYQKSVKHSEELKQVNEELENFVHTVSHDLKSPIASIQGYTTFLLENRPHQSENDYERALERIQANAGRMEKLIMDLLELSRIGRVVNPFEMADADHLITLAQTELLYQLQNKKIDFVVAPNMPQIYCDRDRIVQVFTNLISNAIKYIGNTPEPKIEIKYQNKGDFDQFSVRDNGIGIDEAHHEKIFNLFTILNDDDTVENLGTGVGLTIVKRIVENHSGKIWVESEPGHGSTFYFTMMKRNMKKKDFNDDERNVSTERGDKTVTV